MKMRRGFSWLRLSAMALTLLLLPACSGRRSEPLRGKLDVTDPKVSHGQMIYMEKCDKCHPSGDGGLGPALNNKPLPGFLIAFQARHGLGAMPSFAGDALSKSDLEDLADYLKALRLN
ncbi:MAG: cytochrome c [Fibrobacteria bacterium]